MQVWTGKNSPKTENMNEASYLGSRDFNFTGLSGVVDNSLSRVHQKLHSIQNEIKNMMQASNNNVETGIAGNNCNSGPFYKSQ